MNYQSVSILVSARLIKFPWHAKFCKRLHVQMSEFFFLIFLRLNYDSTCISIQFNSIQVHEYMGYSHLLESETIIAAKSS